MACPRTSEITNAVRNPRKPAATVTRRTTSSEAAAIEMRRIARYAEQPVAVAIGLGPDGAAHAAPVHALQFGSRQSGRDHGNAAKFFEIAVERRERGAVIGAMRAAVHDDGAIDPEQRRVPPRDPQHVGAAADGHLEVVIRDPAAEYLDAGLLAGPDAGKHPCRATQAKPAPFSQPGQNQGVRHQSRRRDGDWNGQDVLLHQDHVRVECQVWLEQVHCGCAQYCHPRGRVQVFGNYS